MLYVRYVYELIRFAAPLTGGVTPVKSVSVHQTSWRPRFLTVLRLCLPTSSHHHLSQLFISG